MPRRFAAIGGKPPPEPRWDQDWFPRLDAAAAYVLVRDAQARAASSRSAPAIRRASWRAPSATAGSRREITAIDPAPRADIEGLGARRSSARPCRRRASRRSSALAAGDMLFIDSSHILMPGTDVDLLFNHVLPALPRRRARARPRRLPARRLSAGMGMARLQRAARRRGADPGRAAFGFSGRATTPRHACRWRGGKRRGHAVDAQAMAAHESSTWLLKTQKQSEPR